MVANQSTGKDGVRHAAMEALADFDKEQSARSDEQMAREAEKRKRKKVRAAVLWVFLLACLGIVAFQISGLISLSPVPEKPLRLGPQATDERTDRCIRNLWEIANLLQQGKPVPDTLLDPAGNRPFLVVPAGDDIIVQSPNPELYGFRVIRVSKKNPVPELIR